MPVSLARRIARIGLLPQRSIEDVVDKNLLDKIKNRTADKTERELFDALRLELSTSPRRLELSQEAYGVIAADIQTAAFARRKAYFAKLQVPKSKNRRSKARRKVEGKA